MESLKVRKLEAGNINKYRVLFYLLGVGILILYHMRFNLAYGDVENIYGQVLKRGSEYFPENGNVFEAIFNFTKFHYLRWSSRNVIEIVLIVVGVMPQICWHILDILMVVLIGYCLEKLTLIQNQKIKYMSIFTFLMMYQISTMSSAGWIATTINYSWVVAMGLYTVLVMQRIRQEKKVSAYSYVMALLAAVFAMNHEQMNGLMLLLLLGILFCDIRKREFRKSLIPFYFINIVEFIIILTCPGNACRRNAETVSYYPVYGEYSFFHKVYEGICSLLKGIFDVKGMAVLTMTILLFFIYLSFYNRQNVFIKLMSVMAFTYSVIKVISFKVNILGTNRFFSDYRGSIGATVLGCCILGAIWMVCCANAKTIPERIGITWVMLSAAATKIVLGFSLAFLVSGERTSIYMFFVLLMLALYFIQKHEELEIFKKRWFFVGVCSVDLLMFAWNYYSLYVGIII